MSSPLGDILYLETHDGKILYSPDDDIRFLVYGGFGAPPVDFITRRGYRQHGALVVDYFLQPRIISIEIWHEPACSRQEYWDIRSELHEFLRHNRGGPITLVLREPNGTKRAIEVWANPGLTFPIPPVDVNNWSVDETIDLIAHDPVWFDPDTPAVYVASQQNLNLVFPITFPIQFGSASIISPTTVTYTGTWASYPIITLFGPYTTAVIENVTTGVRIYMNVAIGGAERRVIDLTPGAQSITDQNGNNRFSDLGSNSDLVNFNLRPDPEVAGGIQIVQGVFIGGLLGTTAFQIDYHERYFAL